MTVGQGLGAGASKSTARCKAGRLGATPLAAARARVASADQAWLDNATVHETAGVWQTAAVWSQLEPDAFAADEARLAAEIQRRYGLDARAAGRLDMDEAGDLRALADAERHRENGNAGKSSSTKAEELDDEVSAGVVLGGISQVVAADRAAAEQAGAAAVERGADELDITADDVLCDSAARRNALARRAAEAGADARTVQGRVLASSANARAGRLATSRGARQSDVGARAPAGEGRADRTVSGPIRALNAGAARGHADHPAVLSGHATKRAPRDRRSTAAQNLLLGVSSRGLAQRGDGSTLVILRAVAT
jgi:hypothetical protein